MHLDLDKIFEQSEREKKSEKKIKKNEREDGCLRLHRHRGGEGHSVHSWAAVYCITTVCDARLIRCKRL